MKLTLIIALLLACSSQAAPLKVNGSTTVNLPVAEAAEIIRAEHNIEIMMDTQGGSSGGISMLGEGCQRERPGFGAHTRQGCRYHARQRESLSHLGQALCIRCGR